MFQAIIRSILISGRLGPNIKHVGCYGLLLKHLKSEELHWLHPDLTVGEVEQRYESHHVEAEWRYDDQHPPAKYLCCFFMAKTCLDCSLPSGHRYDLRIRYVPVNFLEKFQDDRSSLLYFYQQVMRLLTILKALVPRLLNTSVFGLGCRFAATTCSIMLARSATGWPCNLAVWRSGETAVFTFALQWDGGMWEFT